MKILFPALFLLLLTNCTNNNEKKITTLLNTFFKSQNDFRTRDKNLMSKNLLQLIDKVNIREAADIERVKNSEFPTDKPDCIEEDIFSGSYEGQDSLNILEIKTSATTATALIQFTNKNFKETWKDEIYLVNENGWKIDNVIFVENKTGIKNTKELLLDFINAK